MTNSDSPFSPDWVSPPGETIADLLEERGWTVAHLAGELHCSVHHVDQLIAGEVPLTDETALRLEQVLGGRTAFWQAREAQYQVGRERLDAEGRRRRTG